MALNQSVVFSKGGGPQRLTLNSSAPDIVIDGGDAGATLTLISGSAQTAVVGNDFAPGAWSAVSGTQSVAGSTRRAFRQGGADHAVVSFTFA